MQTVVNGLEKLVGGVGVPVVGCIGDQGAQVQQESSAVDEGVFDARGDQDLQARGSVQGLEPDAAVSGVYVKDVLDGLLGPAGQGLIKVGVGVVEVEAEGVPGGLGVIAAYFASGCGCR